MAPRLRQSIASGSVGPGATAVLTHSLNILDNQAVIPDYVFLDNSDFDVTAATSTSVTVQNNGAAAASTNVLVWYDHTVDRALGGAITNLTPRPFIVRGGSTASTGLGIQSFRYTCTGAEGSDFFIALPAARANDTYNVQITLGTVTAIFAYNCPDTSAADRTTTQFRIITSASVAASDQLDILVLDR